jgi:septum formation protein
MALSQPNRLILASGSPARQDLLRRAGYHFEVMPANIDEPTGEGIDDIRRFVQEVAWRKAAAVAPKIDCGLVIAADTVGWIHGQVIGKPADADDARRILKTLGGTEHELWTGVTIWRRPNDLQYCWQEVSRVAFQKLSNAEIDTYLATRTWQGCSGAFAIQEENDPYVRVVAGSTTNVIGLPLGTTASVLALLGVSPRASG